MTPLHVAVAVIADAEERVLVSQRPPSAHQGGLWEFPGGKVERGETPAQALRREIEEELGVLVHAHQPLIQIRHDYDDRSVLLDVHRIDAFSGIPVGREGQPLAWVKPDEMHAYAMPAADRPIVNALRLPDRLLITGGECGDRSLFMRRLRAATNAGLRLIQLRAPGLATRAYRELAAEVIAFCRDRQVGVILNAAPDLAISLGADGVHLNRHRLTALPERPLGREKWVSAACHDLEELRRAEALGVDFVLLSPVLPTKSHPGAKPIGWHGFRQLAARARIPVYALGGMQPHMAGEARRNGGQGVAAIRGFWPVGSVV